MFQKGPPWRPGFDPSSEGRMALHPPALPKPDHTALVQAPSSQARTQHPQHPLHPRAQAQDSLDPRGPGLGTEGERAWPGSVLPSRVGQGPGKGPALLRGVRPGRVPPQTRHRSTPWTREPPER